LLVAACGGSHASGAPPISSAHNSAQRSAPAQATPPQELGAEPGGSVSDAAARTHDELARLGLSDSERAAFEQAWWEPVFRRGVGTADQEAERPRAISREDAFNIARAPHSTLLYFLTDAEIDAVAHLEARAPPGQVHRAFLVRQSLE